MLDTNTFGMLLAESGFKDFSGVPCSYLAPLINYAINAKRFIMANNEGEAVAIASGITLANASKVDSCFGVVLMQNSGLSNALSPLTSLNHTFKIPILGFVSLRGQRDENGKNTDEPQHELLGVITNKLLTVCEIACEVLDSQMQGAKEQILKARKILQSGKSFFFVVKSQTFSKVELTQEHKIESGLPTRINALEILHSLAFSHSALLLATTGKCGRELYEIGDTANQLYMVGSMGCVSALGLGIALKSQKKVLCVDGDSALLMRLGTLSTNAYYAKERNLGNFCHILLDNQSHDSTGGQFNLSPFVEFYHIAKSCGYEFVSYAQNLEAFEAALKEFLTRKSGGASFVYLRIAKGSKPNLGRPKITPQEIALRLQNFLTKY